MDAWILPVTAIIIAAVSIWLASRGNNRLAMADPVASQIGQLGAATADHVHLDVRGWRPTPGGGWYGFNSPRRDGRPAAQHPDRQVAVQQGQLLATLTPVQPAVPAAGPNPAVYRLQVTGVADGTPIAVNVLGLPQGVTFAIGGGQAVAGLDQHLQLTPGAGAAPGNHNFMVSVGAAGLVATARGTLTLT